MALLASLIGAVFGLAISQGVSGLLFGGLLGYLLVEVSGLKSRIATLEHERSERIEVGEPSAAGPTREPPQPGRPHETRPPAEPLAVQPPVTVPPVRPYVVMQTSAVRPAERTPSVFDRAIQVVHHFFTGGNTVVRVGVIVLFFGVAFLLKYAAEHAIFPIELRLSATAIGAIALLYIGARLRRTREGYGLTLEGGAIGILYLTIFAAYRLYGLVPGGLAFGLLVLTCASSAALALFQNSLALAVLGVAGGFLAPVLASTGTGSHVALFSYYAILNAGILAIAWFKRWRPLNLVGFSFTFVIGASWGYRYYQPEFFATIEPFLILFFLFYVAVAVLFARRSPLGLRDPVDGTLVFGVPVVGVLLQAALVKDFEYGLAWSALGIGAFYLGLTWLVLQRGLPRLLAEAYVALGVIFATLAIPLAVDGHWTAAAWAIEGAGILWIGLRQSRLLAQAFGLVIQLGAGFFFLRETTVPATIAVLNSSFVGSLLVSLGGLVSALLLQRYEGAIRGRAKELAIATLVWGLAWWYGGTLHEIKHYVRTEYMVTAWLVVLGASTWMQDRVGQWLRWPAIRYAALVNLVLLWMALGWGAALLEHPFAQRGFIAWPFALAMYYGLLKGTEHRAIFRAIPHVGALWLLIAVFGWELHWAVGQWLPTSDWSTAAVGVVLAGTVFLLATLRSDTWPILGNEFAYRLVAVLPVLVLAVGWMVSHGMRAPGNPVPLPYVPLLNPLDLAAMFILLASLTWILATRRLAPWSPGPVFVALGVLAFTWVNAVLFRGLHHIAHVPYTLRAMLDSVLVQSTLSIFWTVLAFALMLTATRVRLRYVWIMGGGLLGAVVVKLFLVDLSNTGTIERIVSFVGVGVLLLVIGYLAPVPPGPTARTGEVRS